MHKFEILVGFLIQSKHRWFPPNSSISFPDSLDSNNHTSQQTYCFRMRNLSLIPTFWSSCIPCLEMNNEQSLGATLDTNREIGIGVLSEKVCEEVTRSIKLPHTRGESCCCVGDVTLQRSFSQFARWNTH